MPGRKRRSGTAPNSASSRPLPVADRVIETRVQTAPFDAGAECAALVRDGIVGAVVSFTGHVRGSDGDVLELQHYPG
ncbi:MAG: molybdenum cofactor biosynthesis protein MoaE, partial [Pseudomonadota bacterium]